MMNRLERRYGLGHLHFVTCSCYRRKPLLGTERARSLFLRILAEVRERYDFALIGYVVMPEHIHLLMGEPRKGTPTTVMQVLKQRVSRALHGRRPRKRRSPGQACLWDEESPKKRSPFWQRRFYDFNVWSWKKKNEKLNYMHFNPVKRGLVRHPKEWLWSSYAFYWKGITNACPPNPDWKPGSEVGGGPKRKTHPSEERRVRHPLNLFEA
jgi:putative transposase